MAELSIELVEELRDGLSHYYDHAYLVQHPLLRRFADLLGDDATSAVRELRRTLLQLIERLRPDAALPPDDPAWRPYTVLYQRYVLGKELGALEADLQLSRRQIQREQLRGLEAVAIALLQRLAAHNAPATPAGGRDDVLRQELSRAGADHEPFEVAPQIARAVASVRPLAQAHEVRIAEQSGAGRLQALGSPSLFRQLLVGAISFMVRSLDPQVVVLGTASLGDRIACDLAAPDAPRAVSVRLAALPDALLALAQAQQAEITPLSRRTGLRITWPAARSERTVVVVEDNPDLITLFSWYGSGHGLRVVGVPDSREALRTIAETRPDAVVLDVVMEDVDGWEIIRQLKADEQLRRIPIVVCSVLEEPELAISLGADAYLCKPVSPDQLLECLERLPAR